ncbi:MAG: metalloregulator ArsR/SmtB family transcription factor [Saprospiraceae bacterium]
MNLSKANLYPEPDQKLCHSFKGLAHPTRTSVLKTLCIEGEMAMQDLAALHPLTLGAVSQHLDIMYNANFLKSKKRSPFILYNLDEEALREFCESCFQFLMEIQRK